MDHVCGADDEAEGSANKITTINVYYNLCTHEVLTILYWKSIQLIFIFVVCMYYIVSVDM